MSATNYNPSMSQGSADELDLEQLSTAITHAPLGELPRILGQLRELPQPRWRVVHESPDRGRASRSEQVMGVEETAKRLVGNRVKLPSL